ncbi:MAG: type II toxin-antitoxin system VapB family antitoxin [Rhodospirillaceae bacterium]|nr:type II toxin-antitoxin system VapB family antitoxin [Rhodospirillaceae bacterium]
MITTIEINDALLKAVKARAADEHRTLKEVFEQALCEYLNRPSCAGTDAPPIPTFRGRGVQPGVDLTDNAALQAIMASES